MFLVRTLLLLLATVSESLAQGVWGDSHTMFGASGPQTRVYAVAADVESVYVGGRFEYAGGIPVISLGRWNVGSRTWSAIGKINGTVNAIAVGHGGRLYVAGEMRMVDTVRVHDIAMWDGVQWSSMAGGTGSDNALNAVAVDGDTVYAAGKQFPLAGDSESRVARWNGSEWLPLGAGIRDGEVMAIAVKDGRLYVGGTFDSAGGSRVNGIAMWDGATWSPVGTGLGDGHINAIALHGDDLYVAGAFTTIGGVSAHNFAVWDGSAWKPAGTGVDGQVHAMAIANGLIVLGGQFSIEGTDGGNVARWDGDRLIPLRGGTDGRVRSLAVMGDTLYLAGSIHTVGSMEVSHLARWNLSTEEWIAPGNGRLRTATKMVAVGGDVYSIESNDIGAEQALTRWDGRHWSSILSREALDSLGEALALAAFGDDLIIGGRFDSLPGCPSCNGIARWDPERRIFRTIGRGIENPYVSALCVHRGVLYAAGLFPTGESFANVARLDGGEWTLVGVIDTPFLNPRSIAVNGDIIYLSATQLTDSGEIGTISRWDGVQWLPLPILFDRLYVGDAESLVCRGADLFAGGYFSNGAGGEIGLLRWNGTSWSEVGRGIEGRVCTLLMIDDDLYAGGEIYQAGGLTAAGLARWSFTRSEWTTLSPYDQLMGQAVHASAAVGGDIYFGGRFGILGDRQATNFAHYQIPIVSSIRTDSTAPRMYSRVRPNPATAGMAIDFALPHQGRCVITVTNLLGEHVTTVLDRHLPMGEHSETVLTQLPAGQYFYVVRCEGSIGNGIMSVIPH